MIGTAPSSSSRCSEVRALQVAAATDEVVLGEQDLPGGQARCARAPAGRSGSARSGRPRRTPAGSAGRRVGAPARAAPCPAATAPEETSTTRVPAVRAATTCSATFATWSRSSRPSAPRSDDEPTFTTASSGRGNRAVTAAHGCGPLADRRRRRRSSGTEVGASTASRRRPLAGEDRVALLGRQVVEVGLEVEHDLADDDLVALAGAGLDQRRLDPGAAEAALEVADGVTLGQRQHLDPAFDPFAARPRTRRRRRAPTEKSRSPRRIGRSDHLVAFVGGDGAQARRVPARAATSSPSRYRSASSPAPETADTSSTSRRRRPRAARGRGRPWPARRAGRAC